MAFAFPRPSRYKLRVAKGVSGFGMFAQEDIPAGKFLIEYWGEVVPDAVADKVRGRYLFDLENGKTILGGTRKNIARYINHACKPNSEVRVVGNRVYIFSKKRIKAGEEITYDYGKEYVEYFITPHGCRCASCTKKRVN